ncbi:hypothetical protein SKAU_G00271830 [Synaphobranchus kaupii]|uniref:Uncharacterized protein n=1 Tax=Synaphobranchus kaupii TaxID=118154 RepID=A0A9Q1F0C8_SYNKA|nr:hypothetical protein SKAU_G00271830 [Synaphobranchus kaupii]
MHLLSERIRSQKTAQPHVTGGAEKTTSPAQGTQFLVFRKMQSLVGLTPPSPPPQPRRTLPITQCGIPAHQSGPGTGYRVAALHPCPYKGHRQGNSRRLPPIQPRPPSQL